MNSRVEAALEKFAAFLRLDRGASPRTVESYVSDLRAFLEKQDVPAGADRAEVEAHLSALRRKGIGRRSIARKLSAIRLYFKFARSEGWCADDPTRDVVVGQLPAPLPKTMTTEDVEKLLAAAQELSNGPNNGIVALVVRLFYATGMRVSELATVEPASFDLGLGTIRVVGKGRKARIVPVDPGTTALVSAYLKSTRPGLEARAGAGRKPRALFLTPRGRPYTRQGIWKIIKRCAAAAGLGARVSPHVLRHAFATHLLERGMNLRSLQLLLGHSDIATTEVYTHLSIGHLEVELRNHHPKGKA